MKNRIKVNEKDIHKLLDKYSEKIAKITRLDDSDSIMNPIFHIVCESGEEYVLKVSHPEWKKFKTLNEVMGIRIISQKTNIPVPKIFGYSIDTTEIGYEYILMEKLNGNCVKNSFENSKINYLIQIADFIKEFQNLSYGKIGGFISENEIGADVDTKIGPFDNFRDWLVTSIKHRFKEMETTRFKKYISRFTKLLDIIPDIQLPIVFCHGDLAPKNMIEHNGIIIGLIDFEWCGAYPYIYDSRNYVHDFNLNDVEKFQFYKILSDLDIKYQISNEIKDYCEFEIIAMTLVAYPAWYVGKETEGEKFIRKRESDLIKLFEKYNI